MSGDDSERSSLLDSSSPVARILLLAVLLLLGALFASRFVLVPLALTRLSLPLALAAAEIAAIAGTGAGAWRLLTRLPALSGATTSVPGLAFCFLVGYPLFGAIFFLVGLVTTEEAVLTAVLVALVLASASTLRHLTRDVARQILALGG